MVETAVLQLARVRRRLPSFDLNALSVWGLSLAVVLYLGLDGGGYALATHSQAGIVVWWIVVVFCVWGLLPATRVTRLGLLALALFTAFVAWTALAATWSISSGRSLQDLSLVVCYLGILVLAVTIHGQRRDAVRHTVAAIATAIVVVAAVAVASRIWPDAFPAAQQTGQFLSAVKARLSWPVNYWNALAALMTVGVPLLLAVATSARRLWTQAVAAAAIPLVALCGALTLSRGGAIGAAVVVVTFFLLAPERLPKLASALCAALGSAILIQAAFHRHDLQHALVNQAARHQGSTLFLTIVLVCLGVGVMQTGIGLAARHGTAHRLLKVSIPRARLLSAAALVLLVIAAIAAGVPGKVDHAWRDFKNPKTTVSQNSISRFGTASGEGRYQYWQVAVNATKGHTLDGSGPGTFQQLWLPRAPFQSYVTNAHSLYVETLAEEGVVGLILLVVFFLTVIGVGIRTVLRTRYEDRTRAAAVVAALLGFLVFAAFDWVWQVAVLPAAFMLLAGALFAPARRAPAAKPSRRWLATWAPRLALASAGIASLVAIAFPLATSTALSRSQAAASVGDAPAALADAQEAVSIEPGSAAAHLQVALILELEHAYPAAVTAARTAVRDEPENWSNWLVLSRLQAEAGHARASVIAYDRARTLNPHSSLFNS